MKLNKIIKRPIVTEKSVELSKQNRYPFEVGMNATKGSVAKLIKSLFDVDVIEVKTMVVRGKKKRLGKTRIFVKAPKWKKAIVKLKEGQRIDLFPEKE